MTLRDGLNLLVDVAGMYALYLAVLAALFYGARWIIRRGTEPEPPVTFWDEFRSAPGPWRVEVPENVADPDAEVADLLILSSGCAVPREKEAA